MTSSNRNNVADHIYVWLNDYVSNVVLRIYNTVAQSPLPLS